MYAIRSYYAMKVPEKLFYEGKFQDAARKLLPDVNNSGKDQLLFMMECGMMLHAAGDYKTSNKVLLPAAKLANLIPTSVTKQISAFLTNDASTNYKGEDFERVLVHMYLGLNFLMLKDYDVITSYSIHYTKLYEGPVLSSARLQKSLCVYYQYGFL